jgi:hypothetical protein
MRPLGHASIKWLTIILWKQLNFRSYFQIMELKFSLYCGREPCKNMLLRFDIPPLDTHKAIHVKYAWKNFKVLEHLLPFTPSKVGSINSSHRIFDKHRCKRHFMYTSWISLEQKGIIYLKNVYQSHRKGRWNMKKYRGKFKGLRENETSTKQ